PANKIMHQAATRNLLAAETFGKIADVLQTADALAWQPAQDGRNAALRAGWAMLVPSTHHDFITGTAVKGRRLSALHSAFFILHFHVRRSPPGGAPGHPRRAGNRRRRRPARGGSRWPPRRPGPTARRRRRAPAASRCAA